MPSRVSRRTAGQGIPESSDNVLRTGKDQEIPASPIDIVVVDGHPIVLAGMSKIFAENAGYRVVGTGASLAEAKIISGDKKPDILIGDFKLDSTTLTQFVKMINETISRRLIVFTDSLSIDVAMQAIKAGVSGILLKDAGMEEILDATWSVYNGELFVAQRFARQMLRKILPRDRHYRHDILDELSPRERQILDLLCTAKTNREIALNLSVSEKTIKRHMTILMQKMNVTTRLQLAVYAQRYRERE